MDRDAVVTALQAEGVETRCYFSPPVHQQRPYVSSNGSDLPVTTELARRIVTLPIWPGMSDVDVDTIAEILERLHEQAGAVSSRDVQAG